MILVTKTCSRLCLFIRFRFVCRHSNGEEILKYMEEDYEQDNLSGMFRRVKPITFTGTGDLHPGQLYDWSVVFVYNDRDYAIQATYVAC